MDSSYYYYLKSSRSTFNTYFIPHKKHLCIWSKYSWRLTQYYINRAVPNVPSKVCSRKWSMLYYTWFGGSKPPTFYAFQQGIHQPTNSGPIVPFSPLLGPLHWALIWSPLESTQEKNLTCVHKNDMWKTLLKFH